MKKCSLRSMAAFSDAFYPKTGPGRCVQAIGEGTELLQARNGRMFSDQERQVLNAVTNSADVTEPLADIPASFSFLKPTDPWLTDREVVRVFVESHEQCSVHVAALRNAVAPCCSSDYVRGVVVAPATSFLAHCSLTMIAATSWIIVEY